MRLGDVKEFDVTWGNPSPLSLSLTVRSGDMYCQTCGKLANTTREKLALVLEKITIEKLARYSLVHPEKGWSAFRAIHNYNFTDNNNERS